MIATNGAGRRQWRELGVSDAQAAVPNHSAAPPSSAASTLHIPCSRPMLHSAPLPAEPCLEALTCPDSPHTCRGSTSRTAGGTSRPPLSPSWHRQAVGTARRVGGWPGLAACTRHTASCCRPGAWTCRSSACAPAARGTHGKHDAEVTWCGERQQMGSHHAAGWRNAVAPAAHQHAEPKQHVVLSVQATCTFIRGAHQQSNCGITMTLQLPPPNNMLTICRNCWWGAEQNSNAVQQHPPPHHNPALVALHHNVTKRKQKQRMCID